MPPDAPPPDRREHDKARLMRQFDRMRIAAPWLDGWITHLQSDRGAWVRVPAAVVLMVGGVFGVLPFLGLWMLPLGVMLLALDVPALRRPVSGMIIRIRRWWSNRSRKRKP